MSDKYFYRCNDCGKEFAAEGIHYLCADCSADNQPGLPPKGVLKTLFNYEKLKKSTSHSGLFGWLKQRSFIDLTPLESFNSWPPLKVGQTPLYRWAGDQVTEQFHQLTNSPTHQFTNSSAHQLISSPTHAVNRLEEEFEIFLKDDSQNPTFSFKDRASALVSAWAKEQGIDTVIAASTGNAGCSIAGICASQGQRSVIFVPATAPPAKLTQIVMYGAQIVPVNGRYDDAFALSMKATERWGYYNRNTAFNPLTIEGKKTVVFELYDQLGRVVPDYVFAPLGDGVVVSGVFKGFEDLLKLGIIEKMPVIVGVQAAGSPNVFNNIGADVFTSVPSKTIADSISVDVPGNFFMTVDYLKKYSGECLTVTDEEILAASSLLARTSGIFTEPASAAAFAGMLRYMEEGRFMRGSKNVVLLTGSGLKDLRSVQPAIRIPDAIDNDILAVERYLNKKK